MSERDDVRMVCVGGMLMATVGLDGVTAIKIAARHGQMDRVPYVEVWIGEHLHAEVAQAQCSWVEFQP